MTSPSVRWLLIALTMLPVAGCSFGAPPNASELATEDACRSIANKAYDQQHRAMLSEGDQSLSPFSSNGMVPTPSDGLSDRYAHEVAVDNCISRRTSSTQGGTSFGPQGAH